MMQARLNDPRMQQAILRLARMPRWFWVAFVLGVGVPVVVLGAGLLVMALLVGGVLAGVAVVVALVGRTVRRLRSPRTEALGRRENVTISVSSVRVIDP